MLARNICTYVVSSIKFLQSNNRIRLKNLMQGLSTEISASSLRVSFCFCFRLLQFSSVSSDPDICLCIIRLMMMMCSLLVATHF